MDTMRVMLLVTAAFALTIPAISAERTLTGPEIESALNGNAVEGVQDGVAWKQYFYRDGTTTYISRNRPSPGRWSVKGDKYCSQWPPSSNWDCYTMTGEGDRLTFIPDAGGAPWPVRVVKDKQP